MKLIPQAGMALTTSLLLYITDSLVIAGNCFFVVGSGETLKTLTKDGHGYHCGLISGQGRACAGWHGFSYCSGNKIPPTLRFDTRRSDKVSQSLRHLHRVMPITYRQFLASVAFRLSPKKMNGVASPHSTLTSVYMASYVGRPAVTNFFNIVKTEG